jgi:NitT/TauT family transport system permease protein
MPADVVDGATPETATRTIEGLDALEVVAEPRPSLARRTWSATWPKVIALGVFVGAWQLLVLSEWRPRYALAGPTDVWPVLTDAIGDGTIGGALQITLTRALGGYAIALVIGAVVGVLVANFRPVRSGIGSLITGLQTMPSVAWFPLAILLFRISEQAILFVVVLGAAPSIANGLVAGIDNVPPLLNRAGRVLGAKGASAWRFVKLPAALPYFLGGLKQGWAFAWRSLMAGELLVIVPGQESLGVILQTGRDISDSALLISGMLVILFVGIVVDAVCFGTAERWVRRRWGLLAT